MDSRNIEAQPARRVTLLSLWMARFVTVLAAVGTFAAFAAVSGHPGTFSEFALFGHLWSSLPILAIYGAVLASLLRKRPSPGAYGIQLGLGIAGTAFSLWLLLEILGFGAWAGELIPVLDMLILAAFLNCLMFRSALDVPLYLAWDRRARVKFLLNTLVMLVVASSCWYLSLGLAQAF